MSVGDEGGVGGGVRLGQQSGALSVGVEHEIDQALRPAPRLLLDVPEPGIARNGGLAGLGRQVFRDHVEQRRLYRAVAPDKADARHPRQRDACALEKNPQPEPEGDVVDLQNGRLLPQRGGIGEGALRCDRYGDIGDRHDQTRDKSAARQAGPMRTRP